MWAEALVQYAALAAGAMLFASPNAPQAGSIVDSFIRVHPHAGLKESNLLTRPSDITCQFQILRPQQLLQYQPMMGEVFVPQRPVSRVNVPGDWLASPRMVDRFVINLRTVQIIKRDREHNQDTNSARRLT